MMVDAGLFVREMGRRWVTRQRSDDRVWPVRLAVQAQALGQRPQAGHPLLHHGLRTVPGHCALCFLLLLRGLAGGRDQVCAGLLGRVQLGVAHPELLGVALRDLSAAGGVGEVRDAVGAYAGRVGDR